MPKSVAKPKGRTAKVSGAKRTEFYKPPQVDSILRHPSLAEWRQKVDGKVLTIMVRAAIEDRRKFLSAKGAAGEGAEDEAREVASHALNRLKGLFEEGLKAVINGTGIIINTNLGRSPLPEETCRHLQELLSGYCNLEFELDSGKRGDRNSQMERMLSLITGAESALVVNNNAAAVMLAIATLAYDKEVIVSRGELVEIGGSFRLPDVITHAGGRLKEVGTTNKTRLSDYRAAIKSTTGIILKCHQSNFEMRGFVEEVSVADLATLCRQHKLPLVEDLGSGSLFGLNKLGLAPERTVQDSVAAGADLTLFSGDKLLGGPQAGFALGRKKLIASMHANPIYRALRPDKILVALIESVLKLYLQSNFVDCLPVLAMGKEESSSIRERVAAFMDSAKIASVGLEFGMVKTASAFGGGTSPSQTQQSYALLVKANAGARLSAAQLAQMLRRTNPPVIARVVDGEVLIDFRTVPPAKESSLLKALQQLPIMVSSFNS
jgi:L-seryl-tRNA(Ser) seleniumtransferase